MGSHHTDLCNIRVYSNWNIHKRHLQSHTLYIHTYWVFHKRYRWSRIKTDELWQSWSLVAACWLRAATAAGCDSELKITQHKHVTPKKIPYTCSAIYAIAMHNSVILKNDPALCKHTTHCVLSRSFWHTRMWQYSRTVVCGRIYTMAFSQSNKQHNSIGSCVWCKKNSTYHNTHALSVAHMIV